MPTPKRIVWTKSRSAGGLHSRPLNPPRKSPCLFPPRPHPRGPHSRRTTRATSAARPARRPRPLPAHAESRRRPAPRPRPPPVPAPSAPPARGPPSPTPSPRPPLGGAAPAAPYPTPLSPGPQPAQPHPGRRAPRPRRSCRRAGAAQPGANAQGALPQRRGRQRRVGPGRGRRPPVRQSVAAGAAAAAHCTRRRPEEESEPRREGASEVEGEGTSEGGNAARLGLGPLTTAGASYRRLWPESRRPGRCCRHRCSRQ
ncbi:PREDICTED: atherin-like [Bison bison bison]|uniref:Atherin-like n=1 Tax=Bison bison bison TaxID=43346 RepID=A0A6P3HZA7_BISBB|nr:PREDICTED: atherin-like [Bison bison bison]